MWPSICICLDLGCAQFDNFGSFVHYGRLGALCGRNVAIDRWSNDWKWKLCPPYSTASCWNLWDSWKLWRRSSSLPCMDSRSVSSRFGFSNEIHTQDQQLFQSSEILVRAGGPPAILLGGYEPETDPYDPCQTTIGREECEEPPPFWDC